MYGVFRSHDFSGPVLEPTEPQTAGGDKETRRGGGVEAATLRKKALDFFVPSRSVGLLTFNFRSSCSFNTGFRRLDPAPRPRWTVSTSFVFV